MKNDSKKGKHIIPVGADGLPVYPFSKDLPAPELDARGVPMTVWTSAPGAEGADGKGGAGAGAPKGTVKIGKSNVKTSTLAIVIILILVLIGGGVAMMLMMNSSSSTPTVANPQPVAPVTPDPIDPDDPDDPDEPTQEELDMEERDAQRQKDMERFSNAVANFAVINEGRIPTIDSVILGSKSKEKVLVDDLDLKSYQGGDFHWGTFYVNYITGLDFSTPFIDPDDEPYSIIINSCDGIPNNTACPSGQRVGVSFEKQSEGMDSPFGSVPYAVSVVWSAACSGETAVNSGASRAAILYSKEGGGVICVNNE